MKFSSNGIAYTEDKAEAQQYMVEDMNKRPGQQYTSYVKLYTQKKPYYVLPIHWLIYFYKRAIIKWSLMFGYREGQKEAVDYVLDCYKNCKKSAMIISGTGTGKSWIMYGIVAKLKLPTLIVTPTSIIAQELCKKYGDRAKVIVSAKFDKLKEMPDILLMTAQSFIKLYDKVNGLYQLLLIDEGHNMSQTRKDQVNLWKGQFVAIVTATPQRKSYDIKGFEMLMGNIFNTGLESLPVKVVTYEYKYNYPMDVVMKANEGLPPESPELQRRLVCQNVDRISHLSLVIKEFISKGYKRFIVFTDRISHTELIQQHLQCPYPSFILSGSTDKEEIVKNLPDAYVLIGITRCCGEGFDLPELECGILFVSSSRVNTIDQTAGRMRRFANGKEFATYVDFIDNIKLAGSKPKKLGFYKRKIIYLEKKWEVIPRENFASF